MTKNLEQRKGFINRHVDGLPKEATIIHVVGKDVYGDSSTIYLCQWKPNTRAYDYNNNVLPNGYLGTATVIDGRYKGKEFNAYMQNNSDFIHYSLV